MRFSGMVSSRAQTGAFFAWRRMIQRLNGRANVILSTIIVRKKPRTALRKSAVFLAYPTGIEPAALGVGVDSERFSAFLNVAESP